MNKPDIKYIEEFLDEVESLYLADCEGDFIPEYIKDRILVIRQIIKSEGSNE